MNDKIWHKAKELFHEARSLPADKRSAFLEDRCLNDQALRDQVDEFLAFYDSEFLESPALVNANKLLENDNFAPGRVIGRYHIRELIGTGGMGQVFRAEDTELDRPVAFKVLHGDIAENDERVRRFIQEAKAASALNHPNILTIYEIGSFEGARFIVSEYIDGETLRERMRTGLTSAESLEITCQIATALQAAHSAGIVHRDIKPENVMIRNDGLVKVLDFGLAKLTEADDGPQEVRNAERGMRNEDPSSVIPHSGLRDPHLTAPGLVMGTVAYMSPEQARGHAVDARTDLWSLGVVFHEMLTGESPFEGESVTELITSILSSEATPASVDSLPPELTPICQKALTKEKEKRYQSAHDLLDDLQRERKRMDNGLQSTPNISLSSSDALKTQSIRRRPTLSAEYIVSSVKRHRYMTLIVLVAALFGIGLSAYRYYGAPRADGNESREGLVNPLPGDAAGSWTATGPMPASQAGHAATLLPNGKVLVAGGRDSHSDISAYLYDPVTNTWSTTGNRLTPRGGFTATLLTNGKVLIAGGADAGGTLATAELYDYTTGSWTATGSMPNVHIGHTATVLSNGKVLVASGQNNIPGCCYLGMVSASEIYDPVSGTWTSTGAVSDARNSHFASLLPDGKVLIAGGGNLTDNLSSAEIYDPATGVWSPTSSLSMPRSSGTGTTLPDGKVLFAGGTNGTLCCSVASAEIYDPASATWSLTSAMGAVRNFHTAALMADGKILVAGGHSPYGVVTPTAEIYDPVLNSWSSIPNMLTQRYSSTATLLADGRVLVTGGGDGTVNLATAEVYTPGPPDSPAQCPAGKYNNGDGCVDAEPGYFVPAPGASSQFPCPAGSYQPVAGATSCLLALPMSFVPMSGSASQTRCATGYASGAGATVCTPTPGQAVKNLVSAIGSMGMSNGVVNSLNAPLNNIDLNNLSTACGKLDAFLDEVNAKQANGQLTATQADQLRQQGNAIKTQIGCAQRETGTGNNSP